MRYCCYCSVSKLHPSNMDCTVPGSSSSTPPRVCSNSRPSCSDAIIYEMLTSMRCLVTKRQERIEKNYKSISALEEYEELSSVL